MFNPCSPRPFVVNDESGIAETTTTIWSKSQTVSSEQQQQHRTAAAIVRSPTPISTHGRSVPFVSEEDVWSTPPRRSPRLVRFESPEVTALKRRPTTRRADVKNFFFTPEELEQLERDRSLCSPSDIIEVVATHKTHRGCDSNLCISLSYSLAHTNVHDAVPTRAKRSAKTATSDHVEI